jgi:uncharacterized protein YdaL
MYNKNHLYFFYKKQIYFLITSIIIFSSFISYAQQSIPEKKILVLVEGDYNLKSFATGQGREIATLLGHFKTKTTIDGVNNYKTNDINKYSYIFYIGFNPENNVPSVFMHDVINSNIPVIWLNSGFKEFCEKEDVVKKYGFEVIKFDKKSEFNIVKSENKIFSKGNPAINLIQIKNKNIVEIGATAVNSKLKTETPYYVKSGNLTYFSDLPTLNSSYTDRYLLFADKLHDILNEQHTEEHKAIIRIEDITPMDNPDRLREIADILSERGIPFLVGVVPIYVNPGLDLHITLSDRPEVVDALKYMVQNGGTIVMHGVTHQYRGVSTSDFEFWDGNSNKPIVDEDVNDITKKIEMGIDEFVKNGLYPLLWETPHYTASFKTYETVSKFFSACIEQRLAIENFDYGQYYPYIINKDLFGQKIYPENMGYVPLNPNIDSSRAVVSKMLKSARSLKYVRDGIACNFFHEFLNLDLLKEIVDSMLGMGYTYLDIREQPLLVRTPNKIILSGNQSYSIAIDNSYLNEVYFSQDGDIIKKSQTPEPIKGIFKRKIEEKPGNFYFSELVDYHIKEPTFKDEIYEKFRLLYNNFFISNEWNEAKVSVCWNQFAKGAAFNDQSSFVSLFKSLNINVDTIFVGDNIDVSNSNLLVVPYSFVDSLTHFDYEKIIRFVNNGGNIITDRKNKLIIKLGLKFYDTGMKIAAIRDKFYPQEYISWKYKQFAYKFDYNDDDEVFCKDASTDAAVVIGRNYGQGKILYFNTAFDQNSTSGYSHFPFVFEYIKDFLKLNPIFKRENLEFYFDPGLRQNISIENLVKSWTNQGIRIIHVAGWHQYPKYNYDYERLIKLAHANGILVYAWLEPPQVSQKFWLEHPEWREKNYKGEDLQASWRYPIALTDDKCLNEVIKIFLKFINDYNWDGVDLAELYFEAGTGFNNPAIFSPMHSSACNEFKEKYHFDLKQIFNPKSPLYWKKNHIAKEDVIKYRTEKVFYFHERILKPIIEYAKKKKGFQVIVTCMDSYFSPELKEYYGINTEKIIDLQKKYGFLLQIEDPQNKWSTNPSRYAELGKFYSSKISNPNKLLLDLNILSFRKKEEVTPFPTLVQTGVESYQLINYASIGAPRFTIYSEASCNAQDITFFSYASSNPVKYSYIEGGYKVNSPVSFVLQMPDNIKVISIDGFAITGSRENKYIIPAGEHTIINHSEDLPGFSTADLQPKIISFTGNLLQANYDMRTIVLRYKSDNIALVSLNHNPISIKVDDKNYQFEQMNGNDCATISLPPGEHEVVIITGDKFSYEINLTSFWSITAILIYGTIAVILLTIMYISIKIITRKTEI